MNRIFIGADTHNEIDLHKLVYLNEHISDMDKSDITIICGDFGIPWDNGNTDQFWLRWFEETYKGTLLFVDGNHCISDDTDILTEDGWKNIKHLIDNKIDIKIGQFDIQTKEITFEKPIRSVKKYISEDMIDFSCINNSSLVTTNHDMIINKIKIKAKDIKNNQYKIADTILSGISNQDGIKIEDDWIRLLSWVIMDGTMVDHSKYMLNSKKKRIQFKLSKQRKIEKLKILLDTMNIKYTFKETNKSGLNKLQPYYIRIYGDYAKEIWNRLNGNKQIPKEWRNFNQHQLEIFLDTLKDTDGSIFYKRLLWRTISKNDVDIIQEICIKNNYIFGYNTHSGYSGFNNGKQQFHCKIYKEDEISYTYNLKTKKVKYTGNVYCYTMPLGTLITRRNGTVNFIGNCNFDLLYKFPKVQIFGNTVHKINDSIYHLMRGNIYNIYGSKFWAFGGAVSIDKHRRVESISWWPEEIPTYTEETHGIDSLTSNNNQVDYIITHDGPLPDYYGKDPVRKYLRYICQRTKYKQWFFGHIHKDQEFPEWNGYCLYEDIIELTHNGPIKVNIYLE